eukprot:gene14509-5569_t
MERVIEARRPVLSKSEGLSSTAKTFFGLNIFQVIAIGGIQSAMIACGNFKDVQDGGLGPGRRIYMALFLLAVLYSCFLCLFAAQSAQGSNNGVIMSRVIFIVFRVYHISFKNYQNQKLERQTLLVYLTIIDSIGLFILNIIFTWLAIKLYGEYGWKIYKRVRFNIRLRGKYDAIQIEARILGQIRRENKPVSYFFIFGVLAAILYFIYKIISVATKTCAGCSSLQNTKRDIPGEVELHLLYLVKSGIGSKLTVLSLSRNILTSIVTSSAEENGISMDLESPRPSVSNEPRPSIFQYLPKFLSSVGNSNVEETDQAKWLSLPAQLHKGEKKVKHIGSSAKSRISQIFWENDFAAFNSQRSSMSSRQYSTSRFCNCCSWFKNRRISVSAYVIPHNEEPMHDRASVTENCSLFKEDSNIGSWEHRCNDSRIKRRKRSRSIGGTINDNNHHKVRPQPRRFNSLPDESSFPRGVVLKQYGSSRNEVSSTRNFSDSYSKANWKRCRSSLKTNGTMKHVVPSIKVEGYNNNGVINGCSRVDEVELQHFDIPIDVVFKNEHFSTIENNSKRYIATIESDIDQFTLRRTKSSVSSLSSVKTGTSMLLDEKSEFSRERNKAAFEPSHLAKKRKLGVAEQSAIVIRKCSSECDLYNKSQAKGKDVENSSKRKLVTSEQKNVLYHYRRDRFPTPNVVCGSAVNLIRIKMLAPTFVNVEELSSKRRKENASGRDNRKIKSTGKENRPAKEKSVVTSKIPSMSKLSVYLPARLESKTNTVPSSNRMEPAKTNRSSFHAGSRKSELKANQSDKSVDALRTPNTRSINSHATYQENSIKKDKPVMKNKKTELNQIPKAQKVAYPIQDFKDEFKPDPNSLRSILQDTGVDRTPVRGTSTFGPMKRMTFNGISRRKPYSTAKTPTFSVIMGMAKASKCKRSSVKVITVFTRTACYHFRVVLRRVSFLISRLSLNKLLQSTSAFEVAGKGSRERRGSIYHNENYEKFRKLTFEQRLSVIINSRPGLNGTRGIINHPKEGQTRNSFYLSRQAAAAENHTAKALDKKDVPIATSKSELIDSSKENLDAQVTQHERPKPKSVGQLCEINYISPRNQSSASQNHNGSHKKSPKNFRSPFSQKVPTPKKGVLANCTPRKSGPALSQEPVRFTAEARWNIQHGLPLPPKERRYEILSSTKVSANTPKAYPGTSTDLTSSGKNKKSVRWADVLDGRKSDATRQLNFEAEVVDPATTLSKPPTSTAKPEKESIISRIFRSLQNTHNSDHGPTTNTPEATRVTNSHTTPKVTHTIDNKTESKAIPKPFQGASVVSDEKHHLSKDTANWYSATPRNDNAEHSRQPLTHAQTPKANADSSFSQRTPQAEFGLDLPVINCPMIKRSWARTPHAKEEEERKNRDNLNMDNTIDYNSTFSATAAETHLADSKKTDTSSTNCLKGSDSDLFAPDEWRSKFDISKGILHVIDDINKWNIQEDMKKVCSYKGKLSKTPAGSAHKSKDDAPLLPSFSSDNTNRNADTFSETSFSPVHPQRQRNSPISASIVPLASTISPSPNVSSSNNGSGDVLLNYLAKLPELKNHNVTKTSESGMIYSTASLRGNQGLGGVSSFAGATKGKEIVYKNADSSPTTCGVNQNSATKPTSQTQNSQDSTSQKRLDRFISSSRIAAIVEEHLRPVRSVIDNAFALEISQYQQSAVEPSIRENSDQSVSRIDAAYFSKANSDVSSQSNGHTEGRLHSSAGSAFRKISKDSNFSLKERPYDSYYVNILKAENEISAEYSSVKILDTEVAFHTRYLEVAQRLGGRRIETRDCHDPVFKILTLGDAYVSTCNII